MDEQIEINCFFESRWKRVSSCKIGHVIVTHKKGSYTTFRHTSYSNIPICVAKQKEDMDEGTKRKNTLLIIILTVSQQTLKHRSEEKKGNSNRQEGEKQQFWQSCVDNFPGADLAKEATSVELQRQPPGRSGCFSSDVLQSTFYVDRVT